MAITSIRRDWNGEVDIVRMVTTNTLAEAAVTGYLTAQIANLTLANSGTWEWQANDMVLCSASDGLDFFTLSADLASLILYSTAGDGAVTLPVVSGNFTIFDGTLGALKDGGFAPSDATKTTVVMANAAVLANHIAVFTDTAGTIDDDATTAINAGNIQAGLAGTAGTLISFPATASNGSLIISALNAGGAFNTTIRNSVMGQSSVISIPDPGLATSKFLLTDSAGSQTIATGNLVLTLGNLTVSAGNITATSGNVIAGSSGHAGIVESFPSGAGAGILELVAVTNSSGNFNTVISNASAVGQSQTISIPDGGASTSNFIISNSGGTQHISTGSLQLDVGALTLGSSGNASTLTLFPATAANGTLILAPVNAGGAFNTTISNGVMGQSTVYTIPDIGAATGDIVVSTSALRMKSVAGAAAAGGDAAQSFTDTFCTTGSNVIGNWNTQANAASVLKIVPGNGSFVVTSTADAGVGTFNYIITK